MSIRFVHSAACALLVGAAAGAGAAPEPTKPCPAEPTDMLIQYSDIVTCEIAPVGDLDVFRFEGQAGERVVLLGTRLGGGQPCLELREPANGTSIGYACGGSATRLDVVLPTSGVFTLRVTDWYNDAVLSYSLTLERVSPASPAVRDVCPNCVVPDSIDPVGDLDVFSFTGRAGDTVVVQATRTGRGEPCLELFGPTGTPLGPTCGGSIARRELRLDEDGPHTILVYDWYYDEALDYDLFFECFGTCGPTPDLRCEVEMSQPEYSIGDTLDIAKLRLANHGPAAVPLEWKLWMSIPGYGDFGLVDYRFTVPRSYDQTFGPLSFGQVNAGWPIGSYEVGCRFLDPPTGRARAIGRAAFAIQ